MCKNYYALDKFSPTTFWPDGALDLAEAPLAIPKQGGGW